MDEEVNKEKAEEEFERIRREKEERDAEKTRKNREKREKKLRTRMGKGKGAGKGVEGGDAKGQGAAGKIQPRIRVDGGESEAQEGQNGQETNGATKPAGTPAVSDGPGLLIHDDDD